MAPAIYEIARRDFIYAEFKRRGSLKKRSPPHILADEHFDPLRNPPAADP
jgi:hypothetical protein